MNNQPVISIIIPCFNEEEGLPDFHKTLSGVLTDDYKFEIIYVNDGSRDQTLAVIKEITTTDNRVKYISFSRNFGHQNALKSGLDYCTGACAISLDADLQHPPGLIHDMLKLWKEGYDVVYTLRDEHQGISIFKKMTSGLFYRIINILSDTKIEKGAADFRLTDRKVIDQLKVFPENYLFIRGLISWLGFRQVAIQYKAADRASGKSKYTLRKMLSFASSGITAFSIKPLRFSIYLGFSFAFVAFLYLFYALFAFLFTDKAVAGWTSIVVSIMFFGGLNLIMLGIIGEYLGKLFIENKRRPNYIVSETNFE